MDPLEADKLVEAKIKEEDLHIQIQEWINIKSVKDERYKWFHHSPNGGARHVVIAMKFKKMGVRKGFPDYVNPCRSNGWNGLAVELKRPGKKPTKEQREWLEFFRSQGWRAAVCTDFEAFKKGAEEYFFNGR